MENQRDKLSQQLEELFQVRKTDAEQAVDDLTVLYENRSKSERHRLRDIPANLSLVPFTTTISSAQETLISALQSQLASQSPFFRISESESNQSSSTHPPPNSATSIIPHFLTRASADAEQHKLQDELAHLRDELKAKGALVKEREQRISELEQSGTLFFCGFWSGIAFFYSDVESFLQ